jgi:hypothetical protein
LIADIEINPTGRTTLLPMKSDGGGTLCSVGVSTPTQGFEVFRTRLELSDAERSTIRARKQRVEDAMRAGGWTVKRSIFGGSHARRTKPRPTKGNSGDVDIYVVLDDSHRSTYKRLLSSKGAGDLLADVRITLAKSLPEPEIRQDAPAIRVAYGDGVLDVVPVLDRSDIGFDMPFKDSGEFTWRSPPPKSKAGLSAI